jgi:pyridinium-3,5-biscarboxylic acid mononucleotide sulfurtransferase
MFSIISDFFLPGGLSPALHHLQKKALKRPGKWNKVKRQYNTMTKETDTLISKLSLLEDCLRRRARVAVAFSGGVDSTFLLKVARGVLGQNVLAVTVVSELMPRHEKADAVHLAQLIDAPHVLVETDDLSDPAFTANPPDKCYLCKKKRFSQLKTFARSKGIEVIVDGTNSDDGRDYRPGEKAAEELGVESPLREAGLGKDDIRRLSKQLGLPTWDKPAFACLASRIPYHHEITAEKLQQIDAGETFLRQLNVSTQVRVRHHGRLARLEIEPADIHKLVAEPLRTRVLNYFKELGFQYITLDMAGYAMGSLNRELNSKGEK